MSLSNVSKVMTCLEHEILSKKNFTYSQDFDYLLQQDLPCFNLVFRKGQPRLMVKHYLAKLLLPSGVIIEILPKITTVLSQSHINQPMQRHHDIEYARQWVAQMLLDIAQYDLRKHLPAIGLQGNGDRLNAAHQSTGFIKNSEVGQAPWYSWLLRLASRKISAAIAVLPSRYGMQAHNNPQARGKLNLSAQLKANWHRPHYLYSEQTIFETDKLLLQFLATGWQQLQRLNNKGQPKDNWLASEQTQYNEFGENTELFNQVQALLPHLWLSVSRQLQQEKQRLQAQLTNQQTDTLSQALAWCDWVLNHLTTLLTPMSSDSVASSNTITSAFMINMNHAFERWVLCRLESWQLRVLPQSTLLIQPKIDWLATEQNLKDRPTDNETIYTRSPNFSVVQQLIPDACIQAESGEITHVIDVKYKAIQGVAGINSADWQQLFVYKQQLKAKQAWLIYPKTKSFNQKVIVTDALNAFVATRPTLTTQNTINKNTVSHKYPHRKSNINELDKSGYTNELCAVPFDVWQREIMV